MNAILEWIIFLALSAVAIITAAGMILTMSMYRAGLALMTSFVALAGLFILLNADLLAAIQIMMNVGGMLAMVLFMVMIMMDPGGEMMWAMKREMHMPGLAAFSMHMPRGEPAEEKASPEKEGQVSDWTCPMHPEVSAPGPGSCPKCGMTLVPVEDASQSHESGGHQGMSMEHSDGGSHDMHVEMPDHAMSHAGHEMNMAGMTPRQSYQMMVDMAMSTAQLPWALVLGAASALLLILLVVVTPWPLASGGPTQDATSAVGNLLLSRYMIGFEGAAYLILASIAGAVILAKRERSTVEQVSVKQAGPAEPEKHIYTCPMHPEVRQDQPGTCPRCGMTLVPLEEQQPAPEQLGETTMYTCPMHPEVNETNPASCPKCGMVLIPRTEMTGGHS